MFKRMILHDGALCLWIISFVIFLTLFIGVTIWATRLGKEKRERLAALPLDDPPETSNHP